MNTRERLIKERLLYIIKAGSCFNKGCVIQDTPLVPHIDCPLRVPYCTNFSPEPKEFNKNIKGIAIKIYLDIYMEKSSYSRRFYEKSI